MGKQLIVCPECQASGEVSTVESLGSQHTLMGWFPKYDEQGVYHSHDPNWNTELFQCSNKHRFGRKWLNSCPAGDYGRSEPLTAIVKATDDSAD